MIFRLFIFLCVFAVTAFSQIPAIEPGVSQELAKWRAARYSDVRYKLNLTLEKMSPVLKGTMEIRVNVSEPPASAGGQKVTVDSMPPIILDWRKIKEHEEKSTLSNVSFNGVALSVSPSLTVGLVQPDAQARTLVRAIHSTSGYEERAEHLIFRDGVVAGENVIKLDFTSPILTSGSAITRYVDKEDGAEYIYSLFVPSDASTAFPVFDQPDLKARFSLSINTPCEWKTVSNGLSEEIWEQKIGSNETRGQCISNTFAYRETKPISTYVFAFAAGPWADFDSFGSADQRAESTDINKRPFRDLANNVSAQLDAQQNKTTHIYVRKSESAKFKPHAAEVFRLNREAVKYLETYFDYKFPFPKYDLVLIPEFPFGGMEHAGATFLREQSVIFPQEPTKNDIITRANLIFHEAAHQWFGDTVTMRWFDDLWLKEGFATFMAYKALDKIMPEANAWKVFYERVKQAAYQTDSTRGTTAIYQPIANLSAAKSAYGNIVYNKAPAFLRQAEFYLGEDKFQIAVRAFLKKHEFANAGWEDLITELGNAKNQNVSRWADRWIKQPGLPVFRTSQSMTENFLKINIQAEDPFRVGRVWAQKTRVLRRDINELEFIEEINFRSTDTVMIGWGIEGATSHGKTSFEFVFSNYQDYGYGIFLLDDKSHDYVLKNIGREKDAFLRTMMWGSLWDSVREDELDPKEYVELVIKNIALEKDEGTIQTLLSRVTTATNYYLPPALTGGNATVKERAPSDGAFRSEKDSLTNGTLVNTRVSARRDLRSRLEDLLIDKIQNASTQGQRITYYRAFLNIASTDKARGILKQILKHGGGTTGGNLSGSEGAQRRAPSNLRTLPTGRVSASASGHTLTLKTKDKFDIVTRLAILGDPDAPKLLADLEKAETSDDAKRYAYAARAAFATTENKAKFWNDFINNKTISESWIEAAFGPFNSTRNSEMTLPYLEKALAELPTLKRSRKIFFVNGWLASFIGGQRDEKALGIINKFLADNPSLDNDLRLKILENVDLIERAVRIRARFRN